METSRIARKTFGRLLLTIAAVPAVSAAAGCAGPNDAGRKGLITGGFLQETEVARVADLMARDMVRSSLFYDTDSPPRIAVVKIVNDTNQYFFSSARNIYLDRMRTQLKQALGERVKFIADEPQLALREELAKWYLGEADSQSMVQGKKARHGVDYLLTGRFASLDKIVSVPDDKGSLNNQKIVELQMVFSLVDAETGELAWQNGVSSAAAFTTRDFQD